MTKKSQFDCETIFPRTACIISEADGYIAYYEIVEKLVDDPAVRSYATETSRPSHIASKALGLFSQHYTMKRKRFGMDHYRQEFTCYRDEGIWTYKVKEGYEEAEEYASLLPIMEEIKDLLTELANTEDDLERMRLRKKLKKRGFSISKARDYLKSKGS